MRLSSRQFEERVLPFKNSIIFGFDSAWTNRAGAPGAICSVAFDDSGTARFTPPVLALFEDSLKIIAEDRKGHSLCIVAIDQPTIVPNASGSRPIDKVAASLVSFVGGGVQPANRRKTGMFCDNAPIWPFLASLGAMEDPMKARMANEGHFVMEVFPALALPSLDPGFSGRKQAPKYNPANKRKFRIEHWRAVTHVVVETASSFGISGLCDWALQMSKLDAPRKSDQDKLDSALCALIALQWRVGSPAASAMIGDLQSGYMITPVSSLTRQRLESAATERGVWCSL